MSCERADWDFKVDKYPWAPVIRKEEYTDANPANPWDGANDKYGASTYTVSASSTRSSAKRLDWGVFVPTSLAAMPAPTTIKLHIFFTATDARSAALRHAVRYAADFHDSVLLIVAGNSSVKAGNPLCIGDLKTILSKLVDFGAPVSTEITELRVTTHSRGTNSFQTTLGYPKAIPLDKLVAVTVLDASYTNPGIVQNLRDLLRTPGSRLKEAAVTVYDVTGALSMKPDPFRKYRHIDLRCLDIPTSGVGRLRGIGYARILSSADKIWSLRLPGTLKPKVDGLDAVMPKVDAVMRVLPPLGVFTTRANTFTDSADPVMGGHDPVDLVSWCEDRSNALLLDDLATEVKDPSSPALKSTARFVIEQDGLNQWMTALYDPMVYAHEYFVAEVWHETLGPPTPAGVGPGGCR